MTALWPYVIIDLLVGTFMLTQTALFAELVYPLLTPYGILLAIHLMAWFRLGRFMVAFLIPKSQRLLILPWLWLCTVPLHCAGLILWGRSDLHSLLWHSSHLFLSFSLWYLAFLKQKTELSKDRVRL